MQRRTRTDFEQESWQCELHAALCNMGFAGTEVRRALAKLPQAAVCQDILTRTLMVDATNVAKKGVHSGRRCASAQHCCALAKRPIVSALSRCACPRRNSRLPAPTAPIP
jgi:hypothetical protein